MKKLLAFAFLALLTASVSFAQLTKSYYNERFAYSIKYPASFIADPPPTNGDGESWRSADGQAEYTTWGAPVINPKTVMQEQIYLATEGRQVTLKRVQPASFVVSGFQADGRIFYRKTIYVKAGAVKGITYDYIKSFEFVYPVVQRNPYDKTVTEIAHAFLK